MNSASNSPKGTSNIQMYLSQQAKGVKKQSIAENQPAKPSQSNK